jgi:uncharacterized protein (TIGR02757 family)
VTNRSVKMRGALEHLYACYNRADSAADPVQIVRRYDRVADREIVAFIAAGLAFGRVASVMASVEAVCDALGPEPAAFVRQFDPARDGTALRRLGHRWVRGIDLVALIWILRHLITRYGSIEASVRSHAASRPGDLAAALDEWSAEVRRIDLSAVYGRRPSKQAGVWYFFARPSTGSACKRLNLFLRWMVRTDGIDPGGWTSLQPADLLVPLDTHTIRVGRCLGLTRRASPGWRMAAEITSGLRAIDPEDPVRYDFALCHLGMMGGCGWGRRRGNADCPLRPLCHPRQGLAGRRPLRATRKVVRRD